VKSVGRHTRRLPLRGADLVLMAGLRRWKGVSPNPNTLLVVECDGPISTERISRALDRLLDVCPWPAARLRRPLPWGKLHWAAGARETLGRPPVRREIVARRGQLDAALATELNTTIDPRREAPLRILTLDVERDEKGTGGVLVLTWFHPLMDARGGQNLVAHLNQADLGMPWDGASASLWPEESRRTLRERCRVAGPSLTYLRTVAPEPPVSLAGALRPSGRACFVRETFAGPDVGDQRETRELSWRLALVGKAMAELWQRRGLSDAPFLLPVSVDRRPKGAPGPTFGSRLGFYFASFRPSETGDVPALARRLRLQMADALRAGYIEANEAGMEFLELLPLSTMLRVMPWTASGELFSFNCADLAEWPPALAECFGRRVVNVYHVPAVPPRPGLGVFFNRCGDRNNLVVSWLEGVIERDDAARILEVVRGGLGWTRGGSG
jgi:hypothetical protein